MIPCERILPTLLPPPYLSSSHSDVYDFNTVPQENGAGQRNLGHYFYLRAYEIFEKPFSFAWICLMPEVSLDSYDKGFGHLA